jgi:hypothetical protein
MTIEAIVDPFADLSSQSPEKRKKIETESDAALQKAYEKYVQNREINGDEFENLELDDVLDPAQINPLVQLAIENNQYNEYIFRFLGEFIQNSYDHGYNDFFIDLKGRHMQGSGIIKGRKNNNLRIKILGNVSYISFSEHGTIDIHGDVISTIATSSKYSTYILRGKLSPKPWGYNIGTGSERCIFASPDMETYERLEKHVRKKELFFFKTHNIVRFIE